MTPLAHNQNKKRLIFLVIASGVFLSTLDSSMVNIALPAIMGEFQTPLHQTEWVIMSYLLTAGTTLLIWGYLSDRFGRGRFYGCGFLVFGVGSLFCSLSTSLNMLIGARFFQALGAAMMMANGPAIIRETFPPEKLGRSMGLIGVPVSLGLMSGPAVGGYIIEFFTWRTLFLLSLPLSFTLGIIALFILPSAKSNAGARKFDWLGALLWAILLTVVSLTLTHVSSPFFTWFKTIFAGCAISAVLLLFIKIESRAQEPIFPLLLLKKRFLTIGIISSMLSFLILFSVLMLTPFYLDMVLHLPGSRIGLVMMAIPITALLTAPIAGWLSDSVGAKILSTLGLVFSTAGLLLFATITPETSPAGVAGRLALFGIGQATFLSPNSASVLGRMGRKNSGTAAALLATARNVGMMLGIALTGLLFSTLFRHMSGGMDLTQNVPNFEKHFCRALRFCFLAISVCGFLAVFLSWQRPAFKNRKSCGVKKE